MREVLDLKTGLQGGIDEIVVRSNAATLSPAREHVNVRNGDL